MHRVDKMSFGRYRNGAEVVAVASHGQNAKVRKSGNANAFTGKLGFKGIIQIAEELSKQLTIKMSQDEEKKNSVKSNEILFGSNKSEQSNASVIVTYGGTTVMTKVVAAQTVNSELDFFPLTVNYQEKFYSVGKIPGGFFKREGRPTEKETLICRLIDRPIRPLFHKDFKNEVQVICTVLSHDQENDSDVISIIAASAAITLSGLPFMGPLGAAKIGMKNNKLIVNPTLSELKESDLELVVAGTKQGVLTVSYTHLTLPTNREV